MAEPHEELHELHEHAEAAHETGLAPVSFTMAVLAVMVAVVTLLGHRAHTEEILLQTRVTDTWAYFQAKNIRRDAYEMFLDQIETSAAKNPEVVTKAREKYSKALDRERGRQKEIQDEARKLEDEIAHERHRADRFDLSEGILEAALVITSITLLTRRRGFWYFGSALALVGVLVAITGFFVH